MTVSSPHCTSSVHRSDIRSDPLASQDCTLYCPHCTRQTTRYITSSGAVTGAPQPPSAVPHLEHRETDVRTKPRQLPDGNGRQVGHGWSPRSHAHKGNAGGGEVGRTAARQWRTVFVGSGNVKATSSPSGDCNQGQHNPDALERDATPR